MHNKIIIYGLGPFTKLMHYYFTKDSNLEVIGFCVDKKFLTTSIFCDLPVIPFEQVQDTWSYKNYSMFVAIGYKVMRNRKIMFDKAIEKGYDLINYISSHSIIYDDLIIGKNNVIMGLVNIEPSVTIGNNNIIWSDTLLVHRKI